MVSDELGRKLHDRAARGFALSVDEQASLQEWYAHHDQHEIETLSQAAPRGDLVKLRQDVDVALAQLQGVTHRVQVLAGENDTLKHEIVTLQRQLKRNPQPA